MIRVLIVEDERIPAHYLQKTIAAAGYDVTGIASGGAEAIRMARESRPNVIFMDVMLDDGISGGDAALAIRRDLPDVRIIFLTAYAEEQMLDMALQSRAYAYLVKPYREAEIIATLRLAVQQRAVSDADTSLALACACRFERVSGRLYLGDAEVPLGPVALRLIALLCRTPHSSVTIPTIMQHLWDAEVPQQTLRSLIHRIREQTCKELIINVNKLGYRINVQKEAGPL